MNLTTIASLFAQSCSDKTEVKTFGIDTRTLQPGSLFIAIPGEQFDGHDFVKDAEAKGAIAALVNHEVSGVKIPQFIVPDTIKALAELATAYRKEISCPVVALTGSNGKTTVKEMIAAILPQPSHATKGNLNNHLGAPLSVLNLQPSHQYAVFELGANHAGEIAHTVKIVQPKVTLINNIAPAHIEGFGSIDGVARAKGEIHQGLAVEGTAVVNNDDAYAHFWDDILAEKRVLRFSLNKTNTDAYAKEISFDAAGRGQFTLVLPSGQAQIQLQVPGEHNIRNAIAAATCCCALGVGLDDIQRGLTEFNGVKGRMMVLAGKNHSTVIDDTYNANLRSVVTALEVLSKRPGKKIFVFGDMGELGEWSTQHHEEVGLTAKQLGINELMTCGKWSQLSSKSFGQGGEHFASQEKLAQNVIEKLNSDTTVLVKGSRTSAMEKIVQKLLIDAV